MSNQFQWPKIILRAITTVVLIANHTLAATLSPQKSVIKSSPTHNVAQNSQAIQQFQQGLELFKKGDLVAAESSFRKAIEIDGNFAAAYANLGSVLVNQEKLTEAIPQFESAIRLKPDEPQLYYQLGLTLYLAGRPQDAKAPLTKARDLLKQQGKNAEASQIDKALERINSK